MSRPELGDIKSGDKVMVHRSMNDGRRLPASERHVPARVVKASRVWIELEPDVEPGDRRSWMTWRMRRDTQNESTQYPGNNASFVTMTQYEYDERVRVADEFLREWGVTVASGKWAAGGEQWADPERRVKLANLIREHLPELTSESDA